MIEILYIPNRNKYKKECYRCKTIFQYENNDIKERKILSPFISSYIECYIECPMCGAEILHKRRENEISINK